MKATYRIRVLSIRMTFYKGGGEGRSERAVCLSIGLDAGLLHLLFSTKTCRSNFSIALAIKHYLHTHLVSIDHIQSSIERIVL